jgi:hypothetical protein
MYQIVFSIILEAQTGIYLSVIPQNQQVSLAEHPSDTAQAFLDYSEFCFVLDGVSGSDYNVVTPPKIVLNEVKL